MTFDLPLEVSCVRDKLLSADQGKARLLTLPIRRRGQRERGPLVVFKVPFDVEASQRHAAKRRVDMGELRPFGLQEFSPCRCIEEEIPDFDGRTRRMCSRPRVADGCPVGFNAPTRRLAFRMRGELELSHLCDAGHVFV